MPSHPHRTALPEKAAVSQVSWSETGSDVRHILAAARGGAAARAEAVAGAVGAVAAQAEEDPHHGHSGHQAREQGSDAGAGEAQLGEGADAVDEQPVAEDVEDVDAEDYPHGRGGVADAVAPLCPHVEDHYGEESGEAEQVVGADEGQQFGGLAHISHHEEERGHDGHDGGAEDGVDACGGAHERARLALAAGACAEGGHERRDAVGEAHDGQQRHVEEVVAEAGGGQRGRGVVADHHVVDEAGHDGAELSDHDGQPQFEQCLVFGGGGHQRSSRRAAAR